MLPVAVVNPVGWGIARGELVVLLSRETVARGRGLSESDGWERVRRDEDMIRDAFCQCERLGRVVCREVIQLEKSTAERDEGLVSKGTDTVEVVVWSRRVRC